LVTVERTHSLSVALRIAYYTDFLVIGYTDNRRRRLRLIPNSFVQRTAIFTVATDIGPVRRVTGKWTLFYWQTNGSVL